MNFMDNIVMFINVMEFFQMILKHALQKVNVIIKMFVFVMKVIMVQIVIILIVMGIVTMIQMFAQKEVVVFLLTNVYAVEIIQELIVKLHNVSEIEIIIQFVVVMVNVNLKIFVNVLKIIQE